MNNNIIFFIIINISIIHHFFAQTLSKEEEKALKNEIRDLIKNPESFAELQKQSEQLQNRIIELGKNISKESNNLKKEKKELESRNTTIAFYEDELNNKKKINLGSTNKKNEEKSPPPVMFKVQIGAYQNQWLAKNLKNQVGFWIENKDAHMKRYVIGEFKRYEEAQAFTKYLNENGAIAFVAAYFSNKRLENIKDLPEEYKIKEK
jgi:cell division protein FtsN